MSATAPPDEKNAKTTDDTECGSAASDPMLQKLSDEESPVELMKITSKTVTMPSKLNCTLIYQEKTFGKS